jgi:hypothetical protein
VLVDAVEERANMAILARSVRSDVQGVVVVFHHHLHHETGVRSRSFPVIRLGICSIVGAEREV